MSSRPKRQAAIQATQKIESIASKLPSEPPTFFNRKRKPVSNSSRARQRRAWDEDYDYTCDKDLEDLDDEDAMDDDDVVEEEDDDVVVFETRKRVQAEDSSIVHRDYSGRKRRRTDSNRTSTLTIATIRNEPVRYKFTKVSYEDESDPVFDMDVEEFHEDEDDFGQEEKLKKYFRKQPEFEYAKTNAIDTLDMVCETPHQVQVLIESFMSMLSEQQVHKQIEEKAKFSAYIKFIFDKHQLGAEIMNEDGTRPKIQVVPAPASIAPSPLVTALKPKPPTVINISSAPTPVISTPTVRGNVASSRPTIAPQYIRVPAAVGTAPGQVFRLVMQTPNAAQSVRPFGVGSTFLLRSTGGVPGQAILIPTSAMPALIPSTGIPLQTVVRPGVTTLQAQVAPIQAISPIQVPVVKDSTPRVVVAGQQPPRNSILGPSRTINQPHQSSRGNATYSRISTAATPQQNASPIILRQGISTNVFPPRTLHSTTAPQISTAITGFKSNLVVPPRSTAAVSSGPAKFNGLIVISGNNVPFKKESLVTVKPLPLTWPSTADKLVDSLVKLDKWLVSENFKEAPGVWMVNKALIPPSRCKVCGRFLKTTNKPEGKEHIKWQCEKPCSTVKLVERPKVFKHLPAEITLSSLLFAVYYWSIQVDIEDVIKNKRIEISMENIYKIWSILRGCCTKTIARVTRGVRFQGSVSVATAQVGRFCVLAMMGEEPSSIRMTVNTLLPKRDMNARELEVHASLLWNQIKEFVEPSCIVKVCESQLISRENRNQVVFIPKEKFLSDIKNVGHYLTQHLQTMFKGINVQEMSKDDILFILSELMWRERFGDNPFRAFTNIIHHLSINNTRKELDIIDLSSVEPSTSSASSIPATWSKLAATARVPAIAGTSSGLVSNVKAPSTAASVIPPTVTNVIPSRKESTIDSDEYIYVDEYFYGQLKLKNGAQKHRLAPHEYNSKGRCHLCHLYCDNLLIIKHFMKHIKDRPWYSEKQCENPFSNCNNCLTMYNRDVFPAQKELSKIKTGPYFCRICCISLSDRNTYLDHMRDKHYPGEMPFVCDLCPFRSSFHKNLLLHFEAEHYNWNRSQCPYCLRTFSLQFNRSCSQLYDHLSKHLCDPFEFKCDNCCLNFVSLYHLREHRANAHNPSTKVHESWEIVPFRVSSEERSLCVKVHQNELMPKKTTLKPSSEKSKVLTYFDNQYLDSGTEEESDCDPDMDDVQEILRKTRDARDRRQKAKQNVNRIEKEEVLSEENYLSDSLRIGMRGINWSTTLFPDSATLLVNLNHSFQPIHCLECDSIISKNHYTEMLVCSFNCKYSTYCKNAYAEHICKPHPMTEEFPKPSYDVQERFSLVCSRCGFVTNNGNDMATHLVRFGHSSCIKEVHA